MDRMSNCYHCLEPNARPVRGIPLCHSCCPTEQAHPLPPPTGIFGEKIKFENLEEFDKYVRFMKTMELSLGPPDVLNLPPNRPAQQTSPTFLRPIMKIISVKDIMFLQKGDEVQVRCITCKEWNTVKLLQEPRIRELHVPCLVAAHCLQPCKKSAGGRNCLSSTPHDYLLEVIAIDGRLGKF